MSESSMDNSNSSNNPPNQQLSVEEMIRILEGPDLFPKAPASRVDILTVNADKFAEHTGECRPPGEYRLKVFKGPFPVPREPLQRPTVSPITPEPAETSSIQQSSGPSTSRQPLEVTSPQQLSPKPLSRRKRPVKTYNIGEMLAQLDGIDNDDEQAPGNKRTKRDSKKKAPVFD